jgi:Fe-S cluster biogenesis protein NfuA
METAPNSSATQTQDLKSRVQQVLNTIRPALQMDGGDCDLVDVTADGVVQLKLRGSCGSCPSSTMTLKMGIEKKLMSSIPEIKSLVTV